MHSSSVFNASLAMQYSPVYAGLTVDQGCLNSCTDLEKQFGSRLRYPWDDDYLFWDTKQQDYKPACRVQPLSSSDVSYILQTVVQNNCFFAVKSGGHAREHDDSNSVGGVTIDLQLMRSVHISSSGSESENDKDHVNQQVTLGAGHVLLSAYTALEEHGLTFLGGRADSVGLGGYTLGGGYSNLSPKYGLAMDNVFEYEIVLADASIVTASQHHNADLYFALRGGGGNNFGIVTSFKVLAVPQGLSWGGSRSYTVDQTDSILEILDDLTIGHQDDTDFAFWSNYFYSSKDDSFSWAVNQAYTQQTKYPAVFSRLNDLPYQSSSLRLDKPSNFSVETSKDTPRQKRNIFATISHYPSVDMHKSMINIFEQETRRLKDIPGFSATIVTQPLHTASIEAMKLRGGNPVGVEADGPLTVVLFIGTWNDASDDDAVYSWGRQLLKRVEAKADDLNIRHPYLYINYALKYQDPYSGFSSESLERLRSIQRQVDPHGVFTANGLCRGYFKLQ